MRQFDYDTISDVILHLNYTARENGGLFKEKATAYMKDFVMNAADVNQQPLTQMFSMRHEFPTEWYKFLHPAALGGEQLLNFTVGKVRFPFFVQERDIVVMKTELFAKCAQAGAYHAVLSYVNLDGDTVTSSQITMPQVAKYGNINMATLNLTDAGLSLDELDIGAPMSLKLKHNLAPDYTKLAASPPELEDLMVVLHYKVAG